MTNRKLAARRKIRGGRGSGKPKALLLPRHAPALEIDVGGRLRGLRDERKLSIRALAQQSGLSVNTLSLIENGKCSPSVSTLHRIAMALEIPVAAFFDSGEPIRPLVYLTAKKRPRAMFEHGLLESLGAGLIDAALDPFIVTLEPGAGSSHELVTHTGCELVLCLSGRIACSVDAQRYVLEEGDSILFESHLPHMWQNMTAEPSRLLLVLAASDSRNRVSQRHFGKSPNSSQNLRPSTHQYERPDRPG
jgi:transcriptional regulator with XRE-family HTH domain